MKRHEGGVAFSDTVFIPSFMKSMSWFKIY